TWISTGTSRDETRAMVTGTSPPPFLPPPLGSDEAFEAQPYTLRTRDTARTTVPYRKWECIDILLARRWRSKPGGLQALMIGRNTQRLCYQGLRVGGSHSTEGSGACEPQCSGGNQQYVEQRSEQEKMSCSFKDIAEGTGEELDRGHGGQSGDRGKV